MKHMVLKLINQMSLFYASGSHSRGRDIHKGSWDESKGLQDEVGNNKN